MNPFSKDNKFGKWLLSFVQHYDHEKYWRRRNILIDPNNKTSLLIKLYYLFYIKRCDAWNLCSFGTNINSGASFKTPPILWHGPNGIIIGHDVTIGKNVTICQRVTITHGGGV